MSRVATEIICNKDAYCISHKKNRLAGAGFYGKNLLTFMTDQAFTLPFTLATTSSAMLFGAGA